MLVALHVTAKNISCTVMPFIKIKGLKLTILARVISVSIGVVSLEESAFGVSASLGVSSPWRDILIAYSIWAASDIMLENRDGG